MKGVLENHALFLSLFLCGGGVGFCAWGIRPDINAMIHLAEFPNDEFRWRVIALVTTSFVGTFVWDRICTFMFSRHIFNAMAEEGAFIYTYIYDIYISAAIQLELLSRNRCC